jgi:hypothetical protein
MMPIITVHTLQAEIDRLVQDLKENDALIDQLREHAGSLSKTKAEHFKEAAALCQAVANGFVSDVNPDYSPDAAKGADACVDYIMKVAQV